MSLARTEPSISGLHGACSGSVGLCLASDHLLSGVLHACLRLLQDKVLQGAAPQLKNMTLMAHHVAWRSLKYIYMYTHLATSCLVILDRYPTVITQPGMFCGTTRNPTCQLEDVVLLVHQPCHGVVLIHKALWQECARLSPAPESGLGQQPRRHHSSTSCASAGAHSMAAGHKVLADTLGGCTPQSTACSAPATCPALDGMKQRQGRTAEEWDPAGETASKLLLSSGCTASGSHESS